LSEADWRSAERYAALCELSPAELAWEFLRRNPQYHDDFDRWQSAAAGDPAPWSKWGLTFPADPRLSAGEQPIFWRPDVYPRTVVLAEAPAATPQTMPFEPHTWRGEFFERRADDGTHALLVTPRAQHRLWMPSAIAAGAPVACVVTLGADASCGAAAVVQFWRHLRGDDHGRSHKADSKLRRAHLSLQALDGHAAGESYRTLAMRFFGAGRVAGESWRTSSLRDATIRLVRTGVAFADGNYRRLLRQIVE
jgi:hypothetical protein